MVNKYRSGRCKFFRGLIATSQPEALESLLERYEKQVESLETSYIDIVLNSGGAMNYQDVLSMPVPAITLFVQRLNAIREDQNQKAQAASNRR